MAEKYSIQGIKMTFTMHATKKLARGAIIAMTAVALAGPALAAKGGNGNGNGNGNGRGNSANAQNAEKGNNGRGAIASELKGLNAAHANINGLMNANPDSQVGQIYAYQQAIAAAREAGGDLNYWGNLSDEFLLVEDVEQYNADAYVNAILDQGIIIESIEGCADYLTNPDWDGVLSEEDEATCSAAGAEQLRLFEVGAEGNEEAYEAEFGGVYDAALQEAETYYSATLITEGLSEEALNEFLRMLGLLE